MFRVEIKLITRKVIAFATGENPSQEEIAREIEYRVKNHLRHNGEYETDLIEQLTTEIKDQYIQAQFYEPHTRSWIDDLRFGLSETEKERARTYRDEKRATDKSYPLWRLVWKQEEEFK